MPKKPDDFIDSLVGDLKPVKPVRQSLSLATVAAALVAGCTIVALGVGLRTDITAGHPEGMLLVPAGLFAVLAIAAGWSTVAMTNPFVGARRSGWEWPALMAAILPAAALIAVAASLATGEAASLDHSGVVCMLSGLVVGLPTAGALVLGLRRGSPTNPEHAGLLAGMTAGAAGILAVSLACPHNDILHLGIWHGLTVAVAGLAGRWLIPPLVRW